MKNLEDVPYVRDQILETIKRFQDELVAAAKLSRSRIASATASPCSSTTARPWPQLSRAMWRSGDRPRPSTGCSHDYAQLTPEDMRDAARKYLIENDRTIVTLTGSDGRRWQMRLRLCSSQCSAACGFAQMKTVTLPSKSPRRQLSDGVHHRRADRIRPISLASPTSPPRCSPSGGTKDLTYKQVVDRDVPDGRLIEAARSDQEMTIFSRRHARRQSASLLQAVSRHAARSRLARGRFQAR